MTLLCWLIGHRRGVSKRGMHAGIPNVLGAECARCFQFIGPDWARTTEEHARIKRMGAVRRLKVTRPSNVREFRKVAK